MDHISSTPSTARRCDRPVRIATGVLLLTAIGSIGCSTHEQGLSAASQEIAEYAADTYYEAMRTTLAELVAFRTTAAEGVPNAENPEFRRMAEYLATRAEELGLDFADHGSVLLIGLGDASRKIGIVTHGDVVPADPAKWAADPFSLDRASEPGSLVARGVVDDKGPIATALYAMKAVKDRGGPRQRRIELVISLTEESDWAPFIEFMQTWDAPDLNVGIDSDYPVVIAEKAWNDITIRLPADPVPVTGVPHLTSIEGGAFIAQVPEDATAVIDGADASLQAGLEAAAAAMEGVTFGFQMEGDILRIQAHGRAAHSSEPWEGRNAITHLAALLATRTWPESREARMVGLINGLVGTGDLAEQFGDLAYADDFMGPLTLTLATLGTTTDGMLEAGISFRSPVGRSPATNRAAVVDALESWKQQHGLNGLEYVVNTSEPYYLHEAPHVSVLLDVFRYFTGIADAGPIAIGGGTNARLLPNGVNFGPNMPGEEYTGHSEHEFMTEAQFRLNLRMYAAMMNELSGR